MVRAEEHGRELHLIHHARKEVGMEEEVGMMEVVAEVEAEEVMEEEEVMVAAMVVADGSSLYYK